MNGAELSSAEWEGLGGGKEFEFNAGRVVSLVRLFIDLRTSDCG